MNDKFDLIVTNADVVTAADRFSCDIGVRDGRIVALGHSLGTAREVVDAGGMLVLPGGVDAHCHLDQPMDFGMRNADDFASGSRSAACGGTTTIIPFAAQKKGGSLRAAVQDYHQRAAGRSALDYAFHLIVSDPTPAVLNEELPDLIAQGYTSFKIYMTYDDLKLNDRQILEVMSVARQAGALVMVHAENADCIAWLTDGLIAAGQTAPKYHAVSRPQVVEREATHRAISFSELVDVPILIVHVSGAEAIEQIRWARNRGLRIYAETCPQYLYLTAQSLDLDGYEGAKCVCSPPPRDAQNQEAVWRALAGNVFSVFSSDHAPFSYDDPAGKMLRGRQQPFHHIPNGIPGLETRLALLFSGVMDGRLTLQQFVALTSTQPARLYGLYPRKGSIMVGADADLVLWDPQRKVTLGNDMLHHNVDYTPYEGMTVTGWPMMTFSRGRLLCREFEFVGAPDEGEFMPCGKPML
ncbi:dihydropyrimidinase [Pusillimonas sp. TS35]|uniref:dihydropyrimidinase n=1 Tax=Paracandidimonas lactea TaxID=2895524 RepID=UPI0013719660|nr:dihydropyrimidinase [Paracandidimonas lactea]MYN14783.1 dihydropyrimidinase [Pusillimonas sp. TS35]